MIDNLMAEQTTLKEVTAKYLPMNQNQPSYMYTIRKSYEGVTDEEKTIRSVCNYVIPRKSDSLPPKAEVLTRLVSELRQLTGNPTPDLR
jgi:hypothetical protein